MFNTPAVVCFIALLAIQAAEAQGLKSKVRKRAQRAPARVRVDDAEHRRNDLEGSLWEFKVIDAKSKKNEMDGHLRLKGAAVFAVVEKDTPESKSERSLKAALAGRAGGTTKPDSKEERIGDIIVSKKKTKNPREYKFRFDKDDDHELSGYALVKRDTKNKGGVWLGHYTDAEKRRRRFEMRMIED